MINLDEINTEIAKLEAQPLSYATLEKLSWLYTVKDHNTERPTGEIPKGKSEYLCACSGKSVGDVMIVMDELMEVLAVIQPRLYGAVINNLTTELTTKR